MLTVQLVNGLVLGGIYALMALGFTMIFGISKIGNFAYGELMMLGAYITLVTSMYLNLNIFFALIISMVIMFGFGMLMEQALFQHVRNMPMINTFLVSIGLMYILRNVAELIFGTYPFSMDATFEGVLEIGNLIISYERIFAMSITVVLILFLYIVLYKTKIGKAVRSYSQDPYAAKIVGINVKQINFFIFGVSSLLAAGAGSVLGMLFSVNPEMGFLPLLKAFAIVVIGGMGSLGGAIIGGLILGQTEVLGATYISSLYQDVFAFGLMILILLIKPSGLFGEVER